MRRGENLVEMDGNDFVMDGHLILPAGRTPAEHIAFAPVHLAPLDSNTTAWVASAVGEIHRARWGIEVFFKQIQQTLQVCDFLGHSRQAIRWQPWAALLLYVPVLYLGQAADWSYSFAQRLVVVRDVVWDRFDVAALLRSYGSCAVKPWTALGRETRRSGTRPRKLRKRNRGIILTTSQTRPSLSPIRRLWQRKIIFRSKESARR